MLCIIRSDSKHQNLMLPPPPPPDWSKKYRVFGSRMRDIIICLIILYHMASSLKYLTEKLQSVLRVAARLVLRLPSRSPVSASMRDQLHWLSVESRVKFKLALLAYKSVHGLAPEYLSAYFVPVSRLPGRSHLRSADQ